MFDYIRAEFYKVTHRPYLYGFLILMLAGETLMAGGWAFTNAHGNHITFGDGAGMVALMLVDQ